MQYNCGAGGVAVGTRPAARRGSTVRASTRPCGGIDRACRDVWRSKFCGRWCVADCRSRRCDVAARTSQAVLRGGSPVSGGLAALFRHSEHSGVADEPALGGEEATQVEQTRNIGERLKRAG